MTSQLLQMQAPLHHTLSASISVPELTFTAFFKRIKGKRRYGQTCNSASQEDGDSKQGHKKGAYVLLRIPEEVGHGKINIHTCF